MAYLNPKTGKPLKLGKQASAYLANLAKKGGKRDRFRQEQADYLARIGLVDVMLLPDKTMRFFSVNSEGARYLKEAPKR